MSEDDADWKLKLRYGKTTTPYSHFTLFADGQATQENSDYSIMPGPYIMALKVWATDHSEATNMIIEIGGMLKFRVTGKIEIFTSEPEQPPGDNPSAYGANFTAYK